MFIGDLHIIRELKMINDNLKWKVHRQSAALTTSAETIRRLTMQNALLSKRVNEIAETCTSTQHVYK